LKTNVDNKYVNVTTSCLNIANSRNIMFVHYTRYIFSSGKCHIIVALCKQFGSSCSFVCLLIVLIILYSLNNPRNSQIFRVVLCILHQILLTCLYNICQSYFWWHCYICMILNKFLSTNDWKDFFIYEILHVWKNRWGHMVE
jgi:hypothetical protein